MTPARCTVVPPYLLQAMAAAEGTRRAGARFAPSMAEYAAQTLLHDADLRAARAANAGVATASSPGLTRTVSDADQGTELPGLQVRGEGDVATGDPAVDEAYDGLGSTYALFDKVYGRSSLDGRGVGLDATVHYGRGYDNAFFDGERMVFGDGDGEVFTRLTASLSVIGHELTHGVTAYTAGLVYEGQSGALNESVSDVFGALVEQYLLGQGADEASWLIGEGLFLPAVQGRALRDMANPGTAYDDDVLGRDPQPADMDSYIVTTEDNGGVHLNSGIPNRAFHLAALALGGRAWERAGQVWFDVLTGGELAPDVDFAGFAAATVAAAADRFDEESDVAGAVRSAWEQVGIGAGGSVEGRD